MIDTGVFTGVWAKLCRRFGRTVDREEAADYLAYLEAAGLGTEEFQAAAQGCWASREFFPRPADFLAGDATVGWRALLAVARGVTPHVEAAEARRLWAAVPPRAMQALDAIGGLDVIRSARDLIHVRREYLAAYEARVQEEAIETALPSPEQRKSLPGAA